MSSSRRGESVQAVAALDAVWFSQEHPEALSELPGFPRDLPVLEPGLSAFLLTRDGQEALAYADSHGTWIRWLASASVHP